jgi:conjugal transfer/type IV secretion protein DotA/TraY
MNKIIPKILPHTLSRKLKYIASTFAIFIFNLLPLQVFAQSTGTGDSTTLSLTPPDTDLSMGYLSNIFGTVDGVLTSSGSQLLGAMFSIFNGAVLVLGGIVILYTLFISTLNTAHEGEMLGKRWSSMWIPLRSVMGIALLVPKTSGYSFVQIFMMWIAVQGVGAADSVWNKALDYFMQGGILIQQNQNLTSKGITGASDVTTAGVKLLQSMTCLAMMQTQLNAYRNSIPEGDPTRPPPVPNFYQETVNALNNQTFPPSVASVVPKITIGFPTLNPNNSMDAPYMYLDPAPTNGIPNSVCGYATIAGISLTGTTSPARKSGVLAMMNTLYGYAQSIVSNYNLPATNKTRLELGHNLTTNTVNGVDYYIWGGGSPAAPKASLLSGSIISNVVTNYFGIVTPALNLKSQGGNLNAAANWVNTAKMNGWILAGSFYFDVIQFNNTLSISEDNPPVVSPPTVLSITPIGNKLPGGQSNTQYYLPLVNLLMNSSDPYSVGAGSKGTFYQDVQDYGNNLANGNLSISNGGSTAGTGNDKIDNIMKNVIGVGGKINEALQNLSTSQSSNTNPVVAIAQVGNSLVNTVFGIYVGVAVTVFVIGMVMGLAWGFAFAAAMSGLVTVLMGIITPILIPLFVTGLTMVYYIPMVPFIIFLFGVIGWFISVVEAIMAAPLVALGIAHPEGAEILGKAEPAVGLLVNVFLRPTFMIFGLLIGMMLSYVGVWILNQGVYTMFYGATGYQSGATYLNTGATPGITKSVSSNATDVTASLFGPIAFLIIYVMIALQIVQKSFTLIYIIPDEVLKWIGINIKGMGGEAEAEGKVAGGFHGAAQAQGEATAKGSEAGKAGFDYGAAHEKSNQEGVKGVLSGKKIGATKSDGGGTSTGNMQGN